MSLKDFTKEVFTRYGFTEDHINIYLVFLRVPRATTSEVYMTLAEKHEDLTYETVIEITNWLVEKGFLKRIEGIIERYIPLQPYFELFTTESENFRNEIAKIKDAILGDQSDRFEKLEAIQDKSIGEVENAVDTQITAFFEDSDSKNNNKKNRIDNSTNRFTESSKALETNIHGIMDNLNSNLKNISESIVSKNETEVNKTKDDLTSLISKLLLDFSTRVENLEKQLKMELDEHVADDLIDLDEALAKLARQDEPKANLVKLRYFAGLTIQQAAQALEISHATAERHWDYARSWLHAEIKNKRGFSAPQ